MIGIEAIVRKLAQIELRSFGERQASQETLPENWMSSTAKQIMCKAQVQMALLRQAPCRFSRIARLF